MPLTLYTAQSHPGHWTVGEYFNGHDGFIYYCDSYDPRIGFWMTPVTSTKADEPGPLPERRNVSERAIGRTFHRVSHWKDQYQFLSYEHLNDASKRLFNLIAEHKAKIAEEAKSLPPLPPRDLYEVGCYIEQWGYFGKPNSNEVEHRKIRHWEGVLYIPAYFEADAYRRAQGLVEASEVFKSIERKQGYDKSACCKYACQLPPDAISKIPAERLDCFPVAADLAAV